MVETIGTGWWKQKELDGGNSRNWMVETVETGWWKQ